MSVFQKATRQQVPIKIGISGPSGSGKTRGALALATALAQGGKIAVIDTENGSASLYADEFTFDTLQVGPPYLSKKYLAAIDSAIEAGYAILVIDTISHQWEGDGGILQRKDEADAKPGSNHWTNWGPFTKEHNAFRAKLLDSPIRIICTMRSKQAYTQTENGNKKKIEKLGLAPIQREGMEYEFTLVFDVQMDHLADASKDRTKLFAGQRTDLLDPKTGAQLLAWLSSAAPYVAPVKASEEPETPITSDTLMPGGKYKDHPLGAIPTEYVRSLLEPGKVEAFPPRWVDAFQDELEKRRVQDEENAERERKAAVA